MCTAPAHGMPTRRWLPSRWTRWMSWTLLLACLCSGGGTLVAVDVLTWDEGLAAMRAGTYPGYCVFIGRAKSEFLRTLQASTITTAGIPIIRLSAQDTVRNPYTQRTVTGLRLIMNLTGPVNDLTGGCLLFFDRDGILLPHFTCIQNFHKNRMAVVELYCRMVASPLRDKLTLLEFARMEGLSIGPTLALEAAGNRHADFSWLYRVVPAEEVYLKGVDAAGKVLDPRVDPALTVVTRDPDGEVFVAEMRELWEKLSLPDGAGGYHRPPLVVFGPANARYPALDALGIAYHAASLTDEQLEPLTTPMLIMPGNPHRGATEIRGFMPGQVIGQYILPKEEAGLLTNYTLLNPDIPVGDYDVAGAALAPRSAPVQDGSPSTNGTSSAGSPIAHTPAPADLPGAAAQVQR